MNKFAVFYWLVATSLFMIAHFYGTEAVPDWDNGPTSYLLVWMISSMALGSINAVLDRFLDKLQNYAYSSLILIKCGIMLFAFVGILFVLKIFAYTNGNITAGEITSTFMPDLMMPQKLGALYFLLVASGTYSFLRYVQSMIGKGTMFNIVLGKYRQARNEERIFMFLDLKDSTANAERLGNEKFTNLIQDCFKDLRETALKHKVEIYSYVGDEAILAWKVVDGIKHQNCLETFFHFAAKINKRADYYKKEYGIVPEFKAGAHMGTATIAQVGNIVKTSIDYLGDVMNTCSRIEGECNSYGRDFLISDTLAKALGGEDKYEFIGEIVPRGKTESIKLYSPLKSASNHKAA
jgi:adenylate cyclase